MTNNKLKVENLKIEYHSLSPTCCRWQLVGMIGRATCVLMVADRKRDLYDYLECCEGFTKEEMKEVKKIKVERFY